MLLRNEGSRIGFRKILTFTSKVSSIEIELSFDALMMRGICGLRY
jgi:hypothetical protein